MSQDQVKILAVLHMNSDITKQLDYEDVIDDFATKKATRRLIGEFNMHYFCYYSIIIT